MPSEPDADVVLNRMPTRREVMELAGTVSTVALAGCGRSPENAKEGRSSLYKHRNLEKNRETETPVDESNLIHRGTEFSDPTDTNFNKYDPLNFPQYGTGRLVYGRLFYYTHEGDTTPAFVNQLASDWGKRGSTYTIELDDRYTWHNGDPIRARDLVTQYRLEKLVGHDKWEIIESVEEVDERTVAVNLVSRNLNENVLFDYGAKGFFATKHELYKQFLPSEGESNTERSIKQQKLMDLQIGSARSSGKYKHPIGWGPFKHKEQSGRYITLEYYEDFPYDLNWDTYEMEYLSENAAKFQAVISEKLDSTYGVPMAAAGKEIPDSYSDLGRLYRSTFGIGYNYKASREAPEDLFQDRRVRKAMNYIFDRERIKNNAGAYEMGVVYDIDSGWLATRDEHADFVGEGWVEDTLEQYNQDHEKARELLREAGWEYDGENWFDSHGNEVTIEMTTTSAAQQLVNMGQTIVEQLNNFGINGKFRAQELVVWGGQTMVQNRFDITHTVYGGNRPFPYYAFRWPWFGINSGIFPTGHPMEVEIPMPIGDRDGELQTVNVPDFLLKVKKATPGSEEMKNLHRKGMWLFNQYVPGYIAYRQARHQWINTEDWTTPEFDSKIGGVDLGIEFWISKGKIQAKKKNRERK